MSEPYNQMQYIMSGLYSYGKHANDGRLRLLDSDLSQSSLSPEQAISHEIQLTLSNSYDLTNDKYFQRRRDKLIVAKHLKSFVDALTPN